MTGRVVEIARDGLHLSRERGFLVVKAQKEEAGRIPLDDIGMVIAHAHGLTYSNNLLMALAERSVPVVLCGDRHSPAALVWPLVTHHRQTERLEAQVRAGTPLKKRLWQQIVKVKIRFQARALAHVGQDSSSVALLERKVRSGDAGNCEAQAARLYFPLLFGADFRRERAQEGVNALLNYGYTVLRAITARAVMGAGLHPSFPLHHKNLNNPMRLVDDLMEPFRPLVDMRVFSLVRQGRTEVNPEAKRFLSAVGDLDMQGERGQSPMAECLKVLASSLAQTLLGQRQKLLLPLDLVAAESDRRECHDKDDAT
ncbi:MAG TPA: type II CRISPR-associated endonuclease Cas1 [Desulfonatronum sp.]|nr:type II CRISPR-associated endonuclease Cas1 [Desulfonatronum sp.]